MATTSPSRPTRIPSNVKSLVAHINPDTLLATFNFRHPWPASSPLQFREVRDYASRLPIPHFRTLCFPALLVLSKHPSFPPLLQDPDGPLPSLLPLLSPPSDSSFVQQATGLLLLLDQGPRQLLSGADKRWTFGFFDVIALCTARDLRALEDDGPVSKGRWNALGYVGIGHWAYIRSWMIAVLVHSEDGEEQGQAEELIDETRRTVEDAEDVKAEWWDEPDEMRQDPMGFPDVLVEGPLKGEDVKAAGFLFWWLRVMATHKPVIGKFGRYPNRNGALGRIDETLEEAEYLEKMNRWGCVSDKVAAKVKSDVDRGRWSPLKDLD